MPCIISWVEPGSPAAAAGIKAGETLISVNGHEINDCLDYRFYTTERRLTLLLSSETDQRTVEITKGRYNDPGLGFDSYLMDKPKSCQNRCVFCFIDQLPKGLRETLYFKDDDTRLSFLTGNYVTLTNVKDADLERIIEQRIMPVNVSVHTTDPHLRVKMLGNRHAGDIMERLSRLKEGRVTMNCQIVLCPGLNDGAALDKTISDLFSLYPYVNSVSVVPVGITRFREGLYPLRPFTKEEAAATIEQVNGWGDMALKKEGRRIVYLADEFYLKGGLPIPKSPYYDDFPQIENGVGLMASFEEEFFDALEGADLDNVPPRDISVATGRAAFDFISGLVDVLLKKCNNLKITVYCIDNDFFGRDVTVAGLVAGCDLVAKLKGKPLGERLLIPSVMLRSEGDLFLDQMSLECAERLLGVMIEPLSCGGNDFFDSLTRGGE